MARKSVQPTGSRPSPIPMPTPYVLDRPAGEPPRLCGQRIPRASGGYQLIRKTIFVTAFLVGAASTAFALDIPRGASQDQRVRFVNYQPYNITRIVARCAPPYRVEFAARRGDRPCGARQQRCLGGGAGGNILFLNRARTSRSRTFPVVTTPGMDRRAAYQMELTVTRRLRRGRPEHILLCEISLSR